MKQIIVAVSISLFMVILLATSARADLALEPSDDTYIDLNKPAMNLDKNKLIIDYSNIPTCIITRRALLRFDLSLINQDIGSDTLLRLYIENGPAWSGNLVIRSVGDDWNGSDEGIGDETTLTWSNAPAPGAILDTQPTGATGDFIVFSGSNLATHINSQRSANGGDDVVSFVIEWASCSSFLDSIILEDKDNTGNTGFKPQLCPFTPTAILLTTMSVQAADGFSLWPIFCLLFIATTGMILKTCNVKSARRR